eukprot:scaffold28924_cov146-Isochrysis_galbana.AAC.2
MAHEINDRMIIVLTNDQASRERGADNAMKFKELPAAARVRVKNREGLSHEASCVHICESYLYLGPYEEARASLYEKSKSPGPKEAERQRVNHVQISTPTMTTPSSDSSDITQMVAAMQQQMNNIQSLMQSLLHRKLRHRYLPRRTGANQRLAGVRMTTAVLDHLRHMNRSRPRRPIPLQQLPRVHQAVAVCRLAGRLQQAAAAHCAGN